jgi:hypothetical protein
MSNLGEFHHREEPEKATRWIKWVILFVIAVVLIVYVIQTGMLRPHPVTAIMNFPRGS